MFYLKKFNFKEWLLHLNNPSKTVCYYHAMYEFQSKSALHSCLNANELLARNRRDIWSLSDSNGIRTRNYLVCKRTLNQLAKTKISLFYPEEVTS